MEEAGPNAEQVAYWNQQAGPKWVTLQEILDAQLVELGEAVLERAAVGSGERVLDVGCGCGETSLELARRAGPAGRVVGVDISAPMLERARERAAAADLETVEFLQADAQTHAFAPESFDLLFSRFGVMFFADPSAAFANLRRALGPGGRLCFVCWRPLPENPWMLEPVQALAGVIELPAPPPPGSPGPFAFGDADRVRRILETAGFRDVQIDRLDLVLQVGGGDLERAVDFVLQMGPAGAALRDAPEALRAQAAGRVRERLEKFDGPGGVRMPSASWIVTGGA